MWQHLKNFMLEAYGFKIPPALSEKKMLQYALLNVKACQSDWHHQSVLPKGRSFTASAGTKAASLPLQTQEPRQQFYQGWIGAVASHCFSHPILSLAFQQTLKDLRDPRGTNMEVRRVDLANWALQTSPKFTTGVKYQFHQGFWLVQRSGYPNHPSSQ